MANSSVGGLYVTVNLDTKKAVKDLQNLRKEFEKTFTKTTGATGGGGGGDTNDGIAETVITVGLLARAMAVLGKVTKGTASSFGQFSRVAGSSGGLGRLTTTATGATSAMKGLGASSIALGVTIGAITVGALAAAAAIGTVVAATFKLGKAGFNTARDLELLELSLTAIIGSSEAAAAEMQAIQEIARESPFLTPTVIEMDKFLISQGLVSGEIRGNLIPAVLDLAAAFGLGTENVGSISYALAQVQARGYLSGDELRQLANQFIPVWNILREIPVLADLSQQEIRKLAEQGQISAEAFFLAMTAYAGQYDEAARLAALTTKGLAENLRDISTIRLGQAFIDIDKAELENLNSPLAVIRDALFELTNLAKTLDFAPMAAAMGAIVQAFIGPLTEWISGNGAAVQNFFENWLPSAMQTTAKVLTFLIEVAQIFIGVMVDVMGEIGNAWSNATQSVGSGLGGWNQVWRALAGIVAVSVGFIVTVVELAAGVIGAFIGLVTGNFGAAANGVTRTLTAFHKGVVAADNAFTALDGTLTRLGNIKAPDLSGIGETVGAISDAGEGVSGIGAGDDGAGGAAKKLTDDIAKAMDVLWDLTRRWNGLRSDLERGFLGATGFTATIDQIISMAKKVTAALEIIGATNAVDSVIESTFQLIELAKKRTELAGDLADAERALNDLVTQRDRFSSRIRKSAIDFAAALNLEKETVKTWELQSDRGFFISTETTETKDFVESLRERSQALKEFFANLEILRDRGLDEDFLEQLMLAGPAASGDVAKALAAGGQEMLDEVNVLYGDISDTADALAEFGAEEFYDAGIAQAEALVAGITEELDAVIAAAELIGEGIFQVVEPWAKELKKVGASGSGSLAKGLSGGAAGITASARTLTDAFGSGMAGFDDDLYGYGEDGTIAFGEGLLDGFVTFEEDLQRAVDNIESIFSGVSSFFDGLDFTIDGVIRFSSNMIKSFFGAIANMLGQAGSNVLDLLGLRGAYDYLKRKAGGFASGYTPGSSFGTSGQSFSDGYQSAVLSGFGAASLGSVTQVTALNSSVSGAPTSASSGFGSVEGGGAPTIKVYIGDQELKTLVKTEIVYNEDGEVSRVIAGRRV